MVFMRARYYVVSVGRFASADTIVPNLKNPQNLNHYTYVRNSPARFQDPTGHCIPGWDCPGDQHEEAEYWRGLSEDQLVAYQSRQSGNTCAAHAVAASINMLTGSSLSGESVSQLANLTWMFPGVISLSFRLWPNQGIVPFEQANLVNLLDLIASWADAPIPRFSADAMQGTLDDLHSLLGQPDSVVIVSMNWDVGDYTSGHAMILVAYDPSHLDEHGWEQPWGFLDWRSNVSNGELRWLSEESFLDRWGGYVFFFPGALVIGNYGMVVVSLDQTSQASLE